MRKKPLQPLPSLCISLIDYPLPLCSTKIGPLCAHSYTNNDSSKRSNQVSQSSRGIESTNSRVVQSSAKSTDSYSKRLTRENFSEMEREIWAKGTTRCLNPDWRSYVSKPILRRGDDGLSYRVDRTKALGNSVVPQVAAIPLKRVHDLYYYE